LRRDRCTIANVAKGYHDYCPVAHALDLIGERWSLLVIRELVENGPQRYTDLHRSLSGCGTNILAARLKDLETGGIIQRRQLPPPAASTVYELTEYGEELRSVLHQLAHWGARSLGPPTTGDSPNPGWLPGALRIALPVKPLDACIEFRIGDELATYVRGETQVGSVEKPDAVVESDTLGFYRLLVERDLDAVTVRGSRSAVRRLLEALPARTGEPRAIPSPALA
jgi:DNA-binding HxlR family transcriptional regulator